MTSEPPIVYVLDASVAVTGAFVAVRAMAQAVAGEVRLVLVLPLGADMPPDMLRDFWAVRYVPIVPISKNFRAMLRYIPALLVSSWRLHRWMRRDGATRLQLNDFYLLQGVLLRLFGFRGQIVSWVRCDPKRFAGFLARPMLWLAHCAANRMVVVSRHIQSLLPESMPMTLLYDGAALGAMPRDAEMLQRSKVFVYIANYIAGKGQDLALAAFADMAAEDPAMQLHFYGGDMGLKKNARYRQRLEILAKEYGVAERVHFGAFQGDVSALLASAYAALNFSQSESFSMTVLEAGAAGVAVIATASGGPQEIIVDGVTGYVIPVGDRAAAAARMLALARDPKEAWRMGQAAAAHVAQHFSQQQSAAQWRQLWGLL